MLNFERDKIYIHFGFERFVESNVMIELVGWHRL